MGMNIEELKSKREEFYEKLLKIKQEEKEFSFKNCNEVKN